MPNVTPIGQLFMVILHFKYLGATESVVTNAVVLVPILMATRTSGGYVPS